jgi:hypothetical protein
MVADERDGRNTFDYFMDNVARLQTDQHFRDVLRELDEGRKETLSLLASDPAAFLRYRGVQIPHDFRVSVTKRPHDAVAKGGGGGVDNNLRLRRGLLFTILCDFLLL